ncbi:MAG TPA: CheR family methyltransferase [Pyrinomonadaceae bacterium]|nr:CheR family methyltransferase [Pyrinomonadaceae bacterium]
MSDTDNKDPFDPGAVDGDTGEEFVVVGLGASAGGIVALRDFFARVKADSGMAYVVILHLSPDHDSQLASVLQNVAAVPVSQVRDHVRVEPNHVYVIPPNKSLEMADGHLSLSDVTSSEVRRAPVDIFFRTLAESHGPRAVSVVLSGTGANGSMGMKRVKEMGGLCIVQDPKEAEYDDMARHSLATGLVDYVLPAAEMPARIIAYRDRFRMLQTPEIEPEQAESEAEAEALRDIFTQLLVRTGHDFSNYKRPTVLRRVARRMSVRHMTTLAAYARFMLEHPQEGNSLLKDLLISVTNFFRDPAAFEKLERDIIPRLFADKTADEQVRVWVAGCATGEEAYTLAMLLSNHAARLPAPPQIQVFATDIDENAVAVARDGFYTLNDAADVPPDRLARFFVREGEDGFRVRREIRELVLFAAHNVIKDPPFAHLGLVTCRNLLIYLNETAQRRVMDVLHFALNPGGYLMLGASESVDGATELFSLVDREHRIYQGRAVENRLTFPVPDGSLVTRMGRLPEVRRAGERQAGARPNAQLHQRLLELYAPPSVVVSEEYDVVHMSETAGRFMEVRGGELSPNLLQLIRPELRLELRVALYEATHQKAEVESRVVALVVGGEAKHVRLRVRPSLPEEADEGRGFLLVLFEEPASAAPPERAGARVVSADEGPVARRLEEELLEVKAQLSATIEQHELQREELKASNEELQAMNEEMRSAAEELETSKEELQSINEELTTVNQELKIKIEELGHTNDDLLNLMNSSQIGTVFLDRSLRVKFFTPGARDLFSLIPADAGRPLTDISNRLDDEHLLADVEAVIGRLHTVEREVEARDGRWYLMRLMPYRTADDRIGGVVLTFFDITDRKRAEVALRESEEQFRRAIEDAPIPVIMHAEDGEVLQISRTWTELTGYTIGDVPTLEAWLTLAYGEGAEAVRSHMHELFEGDRRTLDMNFAVRTRAGAVRHWSFSASSPGTLRDGRRFIVGMAVDITGRKAAEERLHTMLDSITDYAVILLDEAGNIESWNAGAERIFGFTPEEVVGRHTDIIFTREDRKRGASMQEIRKAREDGRAADERWHLRKDGSRVYMSGVLTPSGVSTPTGFVKIARDLTEQKRAEEELRRGYDELEDRVRARTLELAEANVAMRAEISGRIRTERERVRLLQQIVRAQEDERRRIARDIHDQLGQQMTALRLSLDAIAQECGDREGLCRMLEQTQALAARLDADVDFLAWELRPAGLDDLGLLPAINKFVREWSRHSGIPADFHASGMEGERLAPEAESALYRIMQEALNNAMKYSRAARVDVLLERRDGQVVLIVEDDGAGFDPQREASDGEGIGLIGMRERATLVGGTLEIESAPGEGTAVFARVPVRFLEDEEEEGEGP